METQIQEKNINWPEWSIPSDDTQIHLATILLPYIKILSPEIVKLIVDNNNSNRKKWTEQFINLGIKPDIYLWDDSPVTFPGVRRHSGNKEIGGFKRNSKTAKGKNALLLDDNSFPKQIWAFSLKNYRYVDKRNPANYSLAHISDHKDYKSRNADELMGFQKTKIENSFAGLYTSCINTIWVPNLLEKPTDHNSKIRQLLIQIIIKNYSSFCKILPYNLSFKLDHIEDQWRIDRFPSPTIVGNIDYAKNFIEYRNKFMNDKIAFALNSQS